MFSPTSLIHKLTIRSYLCWLRNFFNMWWMAQLLLLQKKLLI